MTSKRGPTQTLQDFKDPPANRSSSALSALQLSHFESSSLHSSLSSQHPTLFPDIPPGESCGVQPGGCENTKEATLHYQTLPTSIEVLSATPHSVITTSLPVPSPSPPYLPPARPFRVVLEGAQLIQANRSAETALNSPSELHLADIESASTELPLRFGCSYNFAVYRGKEDRARDTIQRSTSSLQFSGATLHRELGRSAACIEAAQAPGIHDLQLNPSLRSQPPVSIPETKAGDFYPEHSITPIYSRQFSLVDRANPSPPVPKKFRSYHSFHSIPPRASSTSTTRLPRYLGNHSQVRISQLGRSLSLTLPQLGSAYVPRRALSLPRILEHRRSTSSVLYIDNRVGNFDLGGRTRVIRRQHSSHRHERKVPTMTPSRVPNDRPSRRDTSQVTIGGSMFTMVSTFPGPVWVGPAPPPPPKDGVWKKVKRALGRLFKKSKSESGRGR